MDEVAETTIKAEGCVFEVKHISPPDPVTGLRTRHRLYNDSTRKGNVRGKICGKAAENHLLHNTVSTTIPGT